MAKAFVETTIIPAVKPNENTFNQLLRPASHKCNIMQYICEFFFVAFGIFVERLKLPLFFDDLAMSTAAMWMEHAWKCNEYQ